MGYQWKLKHIVMQSCCWNPEWCERSQAQVPWDLTQLGGCRRTHAGLEVWNISGVCLKTLNFFHLGPLLCWWGESFQSQGKYSKCGGNCGVLYHHSPFLPGPKQPLEGNKSSFLFLQFPCPTISFLPLARILPIILLFYWEFLITGVLLKAQIIFYGLLNKR